MSLDPELASLLAADNPAMSSLEPTVAQAVYEEMAKGLEEAGGAPLPVASVDDAIVAGVPVRVYRPSDVGGPVPTIVFVHGGGWMLGSVNTHNRHARRLCHDLGSVVVSIDYRLAPQHPFPAGVDDVCAVFDAVARDVGAYGGVPARLAVAGDSAGGTLAAVLAQHARDTAVPLAAQLLAYPATDLGIEQPSMKENAEGYLLTREDVHWLVHHYLGDDTSLTADPRVSPARADTLAGLAPALVVTAEFDPLRDDGNAYADLLSAAGVPVVHCCFDGIVHGFLDLTALSSACEAATAWTLTEFGTLLHS